MVNTQQPWSPTTSASKNSKALASLLTLIQKKCARALKARGQGKCCICRTAHSGILSMSCTCCAASPAWRWDAVPAVPRVRSHFPPHGKWRPWLDRTPVSQLVCRERPDPCSSQANPLTLCGSAPYLACQLEAAMVLLSAGDEWDLCSIPQPIRHKATKDASNSPLAQGIPILVEFEGLKCGK